MCLVPEGVPEEDAGSLGTGVTDIVSWKSSLDPPEEQPTLLPPEPSLQLI